VRTPTLIVHGTRDPLLPVRGARAMVRLMPNAELLVVEGMGHAIASFRYEMMADAVQRNANRAGS
jgi:pimeloyl-ACP methyl ester carboxylesterase